jgi:hypothetical protein
MRFRAGDPDYYEFDAPNYSMGEARTSIHDFLYDHEYEEILAELHEKEARRIKPGFSVQDSKRPVRKRRKA